MTEQNHIHTILQIQDLEKRYSKQAQPALSSISFEVATKEHIGIVGANGSGKTTLFRLILNLITPDAGTIRVMGQRDLEAAKKFVGFVPEHQEGLENFTPDELLEYAGKMSGLQRAQIKIRKDELLEWTGLQNQRGELLAGLSKGMVQRLQLALALIHEPQILLLDEPMSGLDPPAQFRLKTLLKSLPDATFLYASHNLHIVEELCDRVILLHRGRILKDISLAESGMQICSFETEPAILKIMESYPEIEMRQKNEQNQAVGLEILGPRKAVQELLAACRKVNLQIRDFRSKSQLEDLFDQYIHEES